VIQAIKPPSQNWQISHFIFEINNFHHQSPHQLNYSHLHPHGYHICLSWGTASMAIRSILWISILQRDLGIQRCICTYRGTNLTRMGCYTSINTHLDVRQAHCDDLISFTCVTASFTCLQNSSKKFLMWCLSKSIK